MKFKTIVTWEAVEDGMPIPKWCLPLYRDWNRRYVICYAIWIWPFMVIWHLAYRVVRHIAHDVHDLLNEFELFDRARRKNESRADEGESKISNSPD